MTEPLEQVVASVAEDPRRWLVTGGAGFIGSHLVEQLLRLGQKVVVLDDFSTGHRANLAAVRRAVGGCAEGLTVIAGDIRDPEVCAAAMAGAQIVLHQAALGSVPRSIADPRATHQVNVDGFVNILLAARDADCEALVYASSSSVYGGQAPPPAREDAPLAPLSPYASSKCAGEVIAHGYAAAFDLKLVGLRYFNVFGPRQDPAGPYAAVIPRWLKALVRGESPTIFGDGETSRDFCPVPNVVQANLLAAFAPPDASGKVYNVALGGRTTLFQLFEQLRDAVGRGEIRPIFEDFRPGDVRHSQADLTASRRDLGYEPEVDLMTGLQQTVAGFVDAR